MISRHPLYQDDLNRLTEALPDADALRNASVLITGATGLIGACLTDALVSLSRGRGLNLRVLALSRSPKPHPAPEVEAVACDLSQPAAALPRADFIIHAASNAHPLAFSADPVGTMLSNILGARTLLEHLRTHGGQRLLLVSSGEIYGENPAVENGFSEDDFGKIDPMNPRSCYPEGKRAAETLCAAYAQQYGVHAVVARPCYVYGPTITAASSRADAQFLRNALRGESIVLKSPGSQLRSYCYVADAVSALLTILLRGDSGRAYNIAARNSVHTIREYAETLAALSGVSVAFDLPPEAERRGYSTVTRAVQNPARLESLGWNARYPLRDGLARTLTILRESGETP